MKKTVVSIILLLTMSVSSFAAAPSEKELRQRAHKALDLLETTEAVPFERTTHPDAMWYPDASFGLFLHWGIHSVAGIEPSWAMMSGCGWQSDYEDYLGREKYYALADEFDPQNYDPELWVKAAKEAGMTYVVLTSKHHDGYSLWPSEYTRYGTQSYLDGRDLLKPYVDACRKYGLKVGLYFSPRDWSYPDFPWSLHYPDNDKPRQIDDPEKNREDLEAFYRYTVGQISELLTRYGKIDLIWFDGIGWPGIKDIHSEQTLAWVRRIQPHILINPRWGGKGDFTTPEWLMPKEAPKGWWENCASWSGHWGYSPHAPFETAAAVMDRLVRIRAWGGNLLLNVGPSPDGTMPPEYYERCDEIAAWMKHSGESLIGAQGLRRWKKYSDCPLTTRENRCYVHVSSLHWGAVIVKDVPKPRSVRLLRTGEAIDYEYFHSKVSVILQHEKREFLNDVIVIEWDEMPLK